MAQLKLLAASLVTALALSVIPGMSIAASSSNDDESQDRDGSICPKQLHRRSTDQVLQAHFAAFQSANAALIACDYAKNAVFILPGVVAHGPDEIEATFAGFFSSAGAINGLAVSSITTDKGLALTTFQLDSQHIVVKDGADTFVIEKGRIVMQTGFLGGLSVR